jgi:hypothetical protein
LAARVFALAGPHRPAPTVDPAVGPAAGPADFATDDPHEARTTSATMQARTFTPPRIVGGSVEDGAAAKRRPASK